MPSSAKKETFFARIFDMTMHTIISGDTNDHRGMRVYEERGRRGRRSGKEGRMRETDRRSTK